MAKEVSGSVELNRYGTEKKASFAGRDADMLEGDIVQSLYSAGADRRSTNIPLVTHSSTVLHCSAYRPFVMSSVEINSKASRVFLYRRAPEL